MGTASPHGATGSELGTHAGTRGRAGERQSLLLEGRQSTGLRAGFATDLSGIATDP